MLEKSTRVVGLATMALLKSQLPALSWLKKKKSLNEAVRSAKVVFQD